MNILDKEIKKKIQRYVNLNNNNSLILQTKSKTNLEIIDSNIRVFINLGLVNNIRRINKFHELVNNKMDYDNFYVSCSEILEERRKRVWQKAPLGLKSIVRIIDFVYKRVFPKIPLIKKIYFLISRGHNRVISKAETLGRLVSCGFDIVEYFEYENLFYVISKKIEDPDYNLSPSYSPIFKMNRVGFKGQIIGVYKLRTMYPYSEYLQKLIIKENKLAKTGKIKNDYRITTWGKFCRKFWIDELPMIFNLFKGELNVVGVRPISRDYFDRYPEKIQKIRIKTKPGLIPPYYADLPSCFSEIVESEKVYIQSKLKKPIFTDILYFKRAFVNIVFKGARSN